MKLLAPFGDQAARILSQLDPETAHHWTIRAMSAGLSPTYRAPVSSRLITSIAGLTFPNPLGVAAGFDKNACAMQACLRLGFGFTEIGAVTPRPQPGNDRPRVFRLREDEAVINRYGFNNDGAGRIGQRLARRIAIGQRGIVGVNLGANKETENKALDYVHGIRRLEGLASFFTINISSPNTPGLRALQGKDSLVSLLVRVISAQEKLDAPAPIFLKIAPDLTDEDKTDIAQAVMETEISALIISNTTTARPASLASAQAAEQGGLSGAPLFEPSTQLLAQFRTLIGDRVPLIGVGGVGSADQAYEKILAGASLVQLYTAMVYKGPSLASTILQGLLERLEVDGFRNIRAAVGAGH